MTPIIKQPAESLVYEFDFAARLGAMALTAIDAVVITARGQVAPIVALTVGAQSTSGAAARLRLDGGTDGELYHLAITVTDAGAQRHQLDAEFAVIDLAWTVPSVATTYVTLAEFVTRFGIEATVRLTDEAGTGRVDKARIARELADAEALAEGWLAGRFALPIVPTPPLLAVAILDLAMLRLHRGEAPAGVASAGKQAIATLEALGKGTMTLPGTAAQPAAVPADPVVSFSGGRQFTDRTLAGF